MTAATDVQPLTITETALERILSVRETSAGEGDALRVEIVGISRGEFIYDMSFAPADSAADEDTSVEGDPLNLILVGDTPERITGATLDLSSDPNEGLTIDNPNEVWDFVGGDLAKRVFEVLETQVNPSIASHGGVADLVKVEDSKAYLRLGGGCHGCGMASMTLSQGIEVAIKDNVPEIVEIVDVTNHQTGSNPYYSPSEES